MKPKAENLSRPGDDILKPIDLRARVKPGILQIDVGDFHRTHRAID